MRNNFTDDDFTPHKKKSKHKAPRKINHKHDFQPCVLEYDGLRLDKAHGFVYDKPCVRIANYCTVCGKLEIISTKEYKVTLRTATGGYYMEDTEEAKRQFNPETRTLPTFKIGDPFTTDKVDLCH